MRKILTPLLLLLAVAAYAQPQPPLQDERDGKTYKTVKIGTQIWLAENLNYNAEGSVCYENKPENCEKYGRLYNWETAMKSCPSGWHLPSNEEWKILIAMVGGGKTERKLMAKIGWYGKEGKSCNDCTDDYGLSMLPGGYGNSDGSFRNHNGYGYWWSASESEKDNNNSYYWYILYYQPNVNYRVLKKKHLHSVRCVKD